MQNYKIMFGSESMHEDEINQYKNFDALLAQKASIRRKQKLKTWIVGTVGSVVGVAALGYVYQQSHTEQTLSPKPINQVETIKAPRVQASESLGKEDIKANESIAQKPQKQGKSPASSPLQKPSEVRTDFIEASPVGGYEKLYEYLRENCKYPDSLTHTGINGTVLVQFTINEKGKAEKISVVKRLHPALDKEAMKVVAHMPLWTPAYIGGKPLDTKLTLPLTFQNK